jgi:hypothetical protein
MAIKDSFSADEWSRLVASPMMASMAVTAADPSGLIGAVQEATATSKSMLEARGQDGSLAGEIVSDFEDGETRKATRQSVVDMAKGKKPAEITDAAVAELSSVAALVRAKAPEQAGEFTAWLKDLATRVAEASTEGGFLGFGGEKVSDAEKKTLADIDAALGNTAVI